MSVRRIAVLLMTLSLAGQAVGADAPKVKPKLSPPLPGWVEKAGYGVWIEDTMVKITPAMRPKEFAKSPAVALTLAGREYESFQIGLVAAAADGLKNVTVEFSDLKSAKDVIAAANLRWYLVGYILSGKDRVPDMLLPVDKFDAESRVTYSVVVTLFAPPDQPAGVYRGTATLKADGMAPMPIALTAEVYPFTLPKGPGHCRTSFTLSRGLAWDPGEFRKYADFMLDHRLNPDDIYTDIPPKVADLEHYYDLGLNCFDICRAYAPNSVIQKFLDELAQSPHGKEIRKMAFVSGWDETNKETYPAMGERFKSVAEAFPDIGRHTCCHLYMGWDGLDPVAAMKKYYVTQIDIWNHPGYPKYYDYDVGEKFRKAGLEYWAYNINYQTNYPAMQPRETFWEMYVLKADGWLYYAVNGWPKDAKKIDPAAGAMVEYMSNKDGPCSQGELLYRGVNGPIGSLRLLNIRDGIEDYEYLFLLAQKAGDIEVAREMCEQVCWDVLKWTEDPAKLQRTRRTIAEWIMRPFLAKSPLPHHRAAYVPADVRLTWTADQPAAVTAFEVYFGTDPAAVSAATTDSPEHKGRQKSAEWKPGALEPGATYFWRVDEVTGNGTFKGYVWKFTTIAN